MTNYTKKIGRFALGASAGSVALSLMLAATPAFAQGTPAEDAASSEDVIVVTGSLIRNPNLQAAAPVNVTSADTIELKQATGAEQLLREIPGIVPSIGSAVNNGNGGSSFVDLRGLGANRNVVLLDGQRITPADLKGQFDLNNVPLALVERVDVLTGSASTTYGADAVAGVVNFITRRDFAGFELQAGDQITQKGDGNTVRIDATIGANFDDGKGNVVLSLGYQQADPIYQGARSFSRTALLPTDATNTAAAGSPTSTPAAFSVPGLGQPQINAAGALVAPFAAYNFSPYNIFQTPFERFNMYGAGHYEITDHIEVYTRGLYSQNTVDTVVAPSGVFNQPVTINLNNPFLPAAARNTFCANSDFNAAVAGIQTLTAAQCAAGAAATGPGDPNYRTFTTNVRRRTDEVGPRISNFQTKIFDFQAGLRGDLTDSIRWDLSGAYGESENTQRLKGYVDVTKVRQAALSNDGVNCIDPSGGCVAVNLFGQPGSITAAQAGFLQAQSITAVRTSLAQVKGLVSGDFGWNTPWDSNPVSFAIGGEYRKYKASQEADQLSQNPGALGGSGAAVIPFTGGYEVKELFGELVIPVISDKPFFNSFELQGGIRYSSYKIDTAGSPTFNTTTWKGGGTWAPVAGFLLRGNYAHAVRAPNINELFAPPVTSLTNLGSDPCAGAAPTTNATLRDICLAQGAPAFTIGNIQQPAAGQPNITNGGNVNLKPEKANTFTVGAVIQPSLFPGFSASLDYYHIKITDAITTPTPDDIIAACFGANPAAPPAGAAASAACTGIRRDPATGGLDGDQATTPGLLGTLSNLGKIETSGLDLVIDYRTDLGNFAKLSLNFSGNYTFESKFQATPTSINRECVGFYSVNCSSQGPGSIQPKFQWSQRTTLSFDAVDVSLLWRHIDKMIYEPRVLAAELANAALDPVGCPAAGGADPGGCVTDPQFRKIKPYNIFDLSTRFNVGDHFTFTVAVFNLFDKKPPITSQNIGGTAFNSGNTYPSTYDALGRKFGVTGKLRF